MSLMSWITILYSAHKGQSGVKRPTVRRLNFVQVTSVFDALLVAVLLPIVDATSYSFDIHTFVHDKLYLPSNMSTFRVSSCKSPGFGNATTRTSTYIQVPHQNSMTGHAVLHDNLFSHRTTGNSALNITVWRRCPSGALSPSFAEHSLYQPKCAG